MDARRGLGQRGSRDEVERPLPTGERFVRWLSDRLYNDREVDHGVITVALGLWIGLFHAALKTHSWWFEVFSILPSWTWAALLASVGIARLLCARKRPCPGNLPAFVALVSCFLFAFLGFLVAIVEWRMTVTPLFFWLAYQAAKSHARLMLKVRSQEAG